MKIKLIIGLFIINAFSGFVKAQEASVVRDTSYWKLTGITGINLSQSSLVNWVAGGDNSVASNFYLNGSLNYAKERWAWDNSLVLEYGVMYSDENDWRKNADKIAFTSKLGYQINQKWYYSFLGDFNSQFAKGYNYPNTSQYLSKFMAPAYSNLALGVDFKPNASFSFFMSPISLRSIYVLDDSLSALGAYGVDKGKNVKFEAGAFFKASMKKTIMTNVDAISTLDLFTPYNESFGNVDINWDLLLSFKINKLITATLNTTLRYYDKEHYINSQGDDEGAKLQFKEIIGLGIAYRF